MGDVYEGVHVELDKRVAIKTLRNDGARDPVARQRFEREGKAAAKVRHPNVVEVSDVGSWNGRPYLVMEFLEGEDLAAWRVHERTPTLEVIAELMLPVIAAVAAAHDEGVLHRDLKPSNIFLARTRDGALQPKVVDFGISSTVAASDSEKVTQTGAILGTLAYMSPEQAQGTRDLSTASDQYALGVILYECATGRLPVESGPALGMILRISQGQYPAPREVRPELPEEFERLVLRAMALDPGRRFASVRAMGVALLPFAGERGRVLWTSVFDPAVPRGPRPEASVLAAPAPSASPTTSDDLAQVRGARVERPRRVDRRVAWVVAAASVGSLVAWAGLSWSGRAMWRGARTYVVAVDTQPASATLVLDGTPAGAGALRRTFAADGAQHVLRVSAPGYDSREVVFVDGPPGTSRVVLRVRPAALAASAPTTTAGTQTSEPSPGGPESVVTPADRSAPGIDRRHTTGRPSNARFSGRTSAAVAPSGGDRLSRASNSAPERSSPPGVVIPPAPQGVRSPF